VDFLKLQHLVNFKKCFDDDIFLADALSFLKEI